MLVTWISIALHEKYLCTTLETIFRKRQTQTRMRARRGGLVDDTEKWGHIELGFLLSKSSSFLVITSLFMGN
jgi:hypothetical protein